jgi:triacylglycerol lipase
VRNISCRIWMACAAGIFANDNPSALAVEKPSIQNRVLLVHGIADSAASMRKLRTRLSRDGRETLAINLKPGDGRMSLEVLSLQLRDYIQTHFSISERFDLVGFSMGGLVCRYYVQVLGGSSRVDRLVTISAPNHGTFLAFLNGRVACKEMRPGSDFLRKLNEDWSTLGNLNVTSFWTPLDLVIIPAKSSRLPVGINKPIPVLAHPLMILQRRPLEEVASTLSQPKVRLPRAPLHQ